MDGLPQGACIDGDVYKVAVSCRAPMGAAAEPSGPCTGHDLDFELTSRHLGFMGCRVLLKISEFKVKILNP